MKIAPLASTALVLLLAGSAAAQVQYDLAIDKAQSPAMWDGNTSLGPLNGDKNLNFDGQLDMGFGAAGAPFGTALFNGGDIFTDPSTIIARIPNPIPFSPPLAEIFVRDAHLEANSAEATVDGAGNFTTDVVFTFLSGEVEVKPLFGSNETTPLAGLSTQPFPITTNLSEIAGNVIAIVDFFLRIDFTGSTSGYLEIDGTIYATAAVKSSNQVLSVTNLVAGQNATFSVTGGFSETLTYLVYSIAGPGSTYIPQINATLGVGSPVLLAGPTAAGASGNVSWTLTVPAGTTGANVWFQSAQETAVSNVLATTVG